MKNFEERKAEIFRRSEERRYTAKVRNRVLLSCIPLALCLAAAVIITPSLRQSPEKNQTTSTTTAPKAVRQYVEVLAESYYQKYTDLQTYTAVADTLNTIIHNAETENTPLPNGTQPSDCHTDTDIAPEYTITLTDEHGISTYMLTDTTLITGDTGINYRLSENEAMTLRILIGDEQRHRSVGRYLKASNGAHLLVINHSVTVLDDVSNLFTPFDNIQTGDKILVFHDAVEETYPASTDAYYAIRLEMGNIDDIPEKVISNLSLLGWLEPTVSYTPLKPGEGERRIPFEAQYVRTHSPGDVSHAITVIRSVEELHAYYDEYNDAFDLERRSEVSLDSTIGFLDACDAYDAAYFEDRILILMRIGTGSGSHRFRVTDLRVAENDTLTVDVATLVPAVGTCDMAGWHIFIESEVGINVIDEAHVQVNRSTIHLE